MNYLQSNLSRGRYDYTGVFTSADGSGVGSGDPLRRFPARLPAGHHADHGARARLTCGRTSRPALRRTTGASARRLTVNFGVRYEYIAPYTEKLATIC